MKKWLYLCVVLLAPALLQKSNAQPYNYAEVLQKSLFFYEAQQSGTLPAWNRVSWRSNSNVKDGRDVNLDLSGGWHDAGDHIKFNFPMAFSVTALNWGYLEYRDAYVSAGQDEIFKRNIRFVTDYLVKCHTGPTEFYGQVSDKSADHAVWAAAELTELLTTRKSYKVTASNPGTELVCEAAAALASASIVFKTSDPAYSATLIRHAKELYAFGDKYRGFYDKTIPASCCYPSGNYIDELVWGALWLYKATGDVTYLQKAEAEYDNMIANTAGRPVDFLWSLVWEDKSYGVFVILAQLTGKQKYKDHAERHLNYWTDQIRYSPGGQAWLFEWGSLRHSANAALTAFIYADNVSTPNKAKYLNFARRQINYILGDNPLKKSYVIGFGNDSPKNPHHRTVHGSWEGTDRGLPAPASHILYGALVGGPGAPDDQHVDVTYDYQENEVAVDYNACFQGAIARMVKEFGGTPLADFPVSETPTRKEIFADAKWNSLNANGATISIDVSNFSAWPARALHGFSARYYFNISESVAAGYTIANYDIRLSFGEGNPSFRGPVAWDAANHIYYVEIVWPQTVSIMPAGYNYNAKEAQIQIAVSNGVPFSLGNDWSGALLTNSAKVIDNIPIYHNGILVGGNEPHTGQNTSFTITASAGAGGSISPSGSVTVAKGGDQTFAISAATGYSIEDVAVNGVSQGALASYTFHNVQGNQRIAATFKVVSTTQRAYPDGVPHAIPGKIEAVHYDIGGEGVAYHDTTPGNAGPGPRSNESVDTEFRLSAGNVGWTVAGEWVEYTVSVAEAGSYNLTMLVSSASGGGSYHIQFDGVAKTTRRSVASTGSWNTFVSQVFQDVSLERGTQVMRVVIETGGFNFGAMTFTKSTTGNRPPVAVITATPTSGRAPLAVSLSANLSTDPDGDPLTFSWAMSDGTTAIEPSVSKTFSSAGRYSVILTATDTKGASHTDTVFIDVTNGTTTCNFGTPRASALPDITNKIYSYAHVLGSGGPDLSRVTNVTINWSLQHNGLWQFSMNTNNGSPDWWVDLRPKMTHSFNQPQPRLTLQGSGFAGLDGEYYINFYEGDVAMVALNGTHTVYFSNQATRPACTNASGEINQVFSTDVMSNSSEMRIASVYPNPVEEDVELYIFNPEKVISVHLTDMTGHVIETIQQRHVKHHQTITLKGRAHAMYVVMVNSVDGRQYIKVIRK